MVGTALVSVRGEGLVEVDPEVARVAIAVSSRSKDRAQALATLVHRRARISSLLTDNGEAIENVAETSTQVRPEFKEGSGRERVVGYFASSRFDVTIGDFSVLPDLVSSLANEEATSVSGPIWALRPDSPAIREARGRATDDALSRARAYAEAFGTHVLALIELADPGLLSDATAAASRMSGSGLMHRAWSGDEADEAPPLVFAPAMQQVRVVVDARFTIAAPDLNG